MKTVWVIAISAWLVCFVCSVACGFMHSVWTRRYMKASTFLEETRCLESRAVWLKRMNISAKFLVIFCIIQVIAHILAN